MNNWKKGRLSLTRVNGDNKFIQVMVSGWKKDGVGIAKDFTISGEPIDYSRGYGIYHLNSGLLIIHAHGYKETRKKASAILALTNWQASKSKLKSQIPVQEKVYDISRGYY